MSRRPREGLEALERVKTVAPPNGLRRGPRDSRSGPREPPSRPPQSPIGSIVLFRADRQRDVPAIVYDARGDKLDLIVFLAPGWFPPSGASIKRLDRHTPMGFVYDALEGTELGQWRRR